LQAEFWYWKSYNRISRSFSDSVEYSLPHLHIIGYVGLIGFPLYFWVWNSLFPQPYENLPLRLIGAALFLGLVLVPRWPKSIRPYIKIYWFVAFLYALPFFFTFMLLKNDGNIVWAMSTMAGLTLLVLIAYDWVLVTLMFFIGSILAVLAYAFTTDPLVFSIHYWQQLPIYLFVVVAGSIFNYKSIQINQEKLKVLASVGTNIAHELRTPLITIQNNMDGLARYFPKLVNAYRLAEQNSLVSEPIPSNRVNALENVLTNTNSEILHANTIIDMLLMNAKKTDIANIPFDYFWMADIVNSALERYPFESELERQKIHIQWQSNFEFWGSDLLMTHVIFNLIKNALICINESNKGSVEITLAQDNNNNYLFFKDTANGIPSRDLPCIFDHLYTSGNQKKNGTGIGLSFCKKVMEHFNGKIECKSQYGDHTKFILSFPIKKIEIGT